jgi:uncharacterized protein YcbK (DUF882 family)
MVYIFLEYVKKNYITLLAIGVIGYIIYQISEMFSEQKEQNESNATGADYAPVGADSFQFANFKLSDLDCKDGTPVPQEYTGNAYRLLQNLQILRNHTGLPININSGYRTVAHNNKVSPKAPKSAHLRAMAADIVIIGMTPKQVYNTILQLIEEGKMQDGGVGSYAGFTHYDVAQPRRW